MIFAGDQWIQYPVKDLYDKNIMKMAIQTARDMYEKGQQEIKDFNTKYGDFLTPIQKDQDWYNENVTGKMQDVINNLYANGIDPVRSAEGRAAISQLVNTMPVGDIAKVKTSAAAANEYLKNKAILQSKGLWNPELESQILGGKSVEDWDTMGGGQVFTRTSPTEYQDLNQFTSHIFDNIKDSYIGTRDGYDYFGVTANDLMNSLTPDTLGGLLNSDLGRFHYNNARNDLLARGIENPTNDQIMQQFRNNIIAANNERIHSDRKMNEQYKLNQEHASRMAAARRSAAGRQTQQQVTPQYSFAEIVRRNTPTSVMGIPVEYYDLNTAALLTAQRSEQNRFGNEVSKQTSHKSGSKVGINMFEQKYGQNQYTAKDVTEYLKSMGFVSYNDSPNEFIVPASQYKKLFSKESVVTHTAGFRSAKQFTPRRGLYDSGFVTIVVDPVVSSYQAFMKDSKNKAYFKFRVRSWDKKNNTNGAEEDPKVNNERVMYWDSDISSVQNDPRLGSLDKTGQIVDTQNSRLQNAIMADKYTTEQLAKGTDYGISETLSEMPGFGQ